MKRFLSFILTITLILGGCSVSGGEEPDDSPEPGDPILTKSNIELTVLVEPGGEEEFIRAAAGEFTQKYPNIQIRAEALGAEDILRRARNGEGDLFALPHTELKSLAEDLLILSARDQTKTRDALFPACAQAATVKGGIYGYPVSAETAALFYNRRLIGEDEVPSTWEELIAFAKAFDDGDRLGFVAPVGSPYAAAAFLLFPGNRPYDPDRPDNLLTADAVEGLEVFKKLKDAVGLPSEELSDAAVETLFMQGRAALCISGSWNTARFIGAGIDLGVAPLPAFSKDGEETPSASLAFARVVAVSAHSEWPDEASAFADTLLTEKMQKLRFELTGELPSVDMQMNSPSYAAGFLAQMRNAVSAPELGFWDLFGQSAARIWDGGGIQAELDALAEELRKSREEQKNEGGLDNGD